MQAGVGGDGLLSLAPGPLGQGCVGRRGGGEAVEGGQVVVGQEGGHAGGLGIDLLGQQLVAVAAHGAGERAQQVGVVDQPRHLVLGVFGIDDGLFGEPHPKVVGAAADGHVHGLGVGGLGAGGASGAVGVALGGVGGDRVAVGQRAVDAPVEAAGQVLHGHDDLASLVEVDDDGAGISARGQSHIDDHPSLRGVDEVAPALGPLGP